MAEMVTISDNRILVSLIKIEICRLKLFLLTLFSEIIHNFIKIVGLQNLFVRLHQPFIESFYNLCIRI